jgi:hypothetical protein
VNTDTDGNLAYNGFIDNLGAFNHCGQPYDPNVHCGLNQETADFGLPQCMIGFGQFAVGTLERRLLRVGHRADDPGETPLLVEICDSGATDCRPVSADASVELTRYRTSRLATVPTTSLVVPATTASSAVPGGQTPGRDRRRRVDRQ